MKYRSRNPSAIKVNHVASEAYQTVPNLIVFEVEPTTLGGTFQEHLITLYGPPKIGKTTMVSMFPGVYLLPTEPGYKWVKCRKTYIPNWATFRKFVQMIEKKKTMLDSIKVFAIDTTTNLSKFCMQWVCGREGIAHPTDQDWGKGWEAYGDEFAYWILRLGQLGKGIIFVAHEKTEEVISRRMKITRVRPDLPGTTYRIVNALSNIILNMSYVERSRKADELGLLRCLYAQGSETRDAGDQTHKLPDVIKFKTEKQAVRKILACFGSKDEARKENRNARIRKKRKRVHRH